MIYQPMECNDKAQMTGRGTKRTELKKEWDRLDLGWRIDTGKDEAPKRQNVIQNFFFKKMTW